MYFHHKKYPSFFIGCHLFKMFYYLNNAFFNCLSQFDIAYWNIEIYTDILKLSSLVYFCRKNFLNASVIRFLFIVSNYSFKKRGSSLNFEKRFGECFVIFSLKMITLCPWNPCKRGCAENLVSVFLLYQAFAKHQK